MLATLFSEEIEQRMRDLFQSLNDLSQLLSCSGSGYRSRTLMADYVADLR